MSSATRLSSRQRFLNHDGFTLLQIMMVSAVLGLMTIFLSEVVRYISRQAAATRLVTARDQLVIRLRAISTSPGSLYVSSGLPGNNALNPALYACVEGTGGADCTDTTLGTAQAFVLYTTLWDSGTNARTSPPDGKVAEGTGVNPGVRYTLSGDLCPPAIAVDVSEFARTYCPFEAHTSFYSRCFGGSPCQIAQVVGVNVRVRMRADYVSANRLGGNLDPVTRSDELFVPLITGGWYSKLFFWPIFDPPGVSGPQLSPEAS